jgi:signal transduction histidine kinase
VTDRKKAEQELTVIRENLERLVERRTSELLNTNQELEREIVRRKAADEALQSTHRQLKDIIEFLPDATFVINSQKKIIAWNRAIEKMTGVSEEEMIGKGDYAYSVPFYGKPRPILIDFVMAEIAELEKQYDAVTKKGGTVMGEVFVPMTYEGQGAYLSGTASPLFDGDGNMIGAIESIRDITEQKKARDDLLQSQVQLHLLSSRLLEAQEEERKRIARELHDTIGQALAALKFNVENIQYQMTHGQLEAASRLLEFLVPKIQDVIEEARRIYMGLRPSILDDLGIHATIGWYCREHQKLYPRTFIETQIDIPEEEIRDDLKIVIFRIIQESLNNIAKHSEAEYVTLSLVRTEGMLELIIEDNGLGFDFTAVQKREDGKKGMGIAGMRERSELSGGAFYVQSLPGRGTTVWAAWPMDGSETP